MGLDRAQYDYHHWTGLMILMCVFFQFDLDFFFDLIFDFYLHRDIGVECEGENYKLFSISIGPSKSRIVLGLRKAPNFDWTTNNVVKVEP